MAPLVIDALRAVIGGPAQDEERAPRGTVQRSQVLALADPLRAAHGFELRHLIDNVGLLDSAARVVGADYTNRVRLPQDTQYVLHPRTRLGQLDSYPDLLSGGASGSPRRLSYS